jgi:prolyl-tRNA editing enzyme YbaK/EbsC (Cys-tRNA(Pro) deacylase)
MAAGHPDTITRFPKGTHSAADAAASVGCRVAQIAKSIIFRAGDKAALVIASGAHRVDRDLVMAALGVRVTSAAANWISAVTGFEVGGVAPVGHLVPPLALLDATLFEHDPIWASAGSPHHVFRTTGAELMRLTGARPAIIA